MKIRIWLVWGGGYWSLLLFPTTITIALSPFLLVILLFISRKNEANPTSSTLTMGVGGHTLQNPQISCLSAPTNSLKKFFYKRLGTSDFAFDVINYWNIVPFCVPSRHTSLLTNFIMLLWSFIFILILDSWGIFIKSWLLFLHRENAVKINTNFLFSFHLTQNIKKNEDEFNTAPYNYKE